MIINVKNISKTFKAFHREPGLKGAINSFFKRNYKNFDVLSNINLQVDEGEIIGIGSGGNYALSAAKALIDTEMSAEEIALKSLKIASEICVYTNNNITVEKIEY